MSRTVQSTRMEKELKALREIFDTAALDDDAGRMIQLSRVIIQHEKEISKQRITEAVMIDIEQINAVLDDAVFVIVDVAKKHLTDHTYRLFIDELLKRFKEAEDRHYGRRPHLFAYEETRQTGGDSSDYERHERSGDGGTHTDDDGDQCSSDRQGTHSV